MNARIWLLGLLIAGAGCAREASSGTASTAAPEPSSEREAHVGGIAARELQGTYSGDWGTMYLVFQGTEVRGAYEHENGRVVGRIEGDLIRGTWCQDQSASGHPPTGPFEFRFTRDQSGVPQLDGRWAYVDTPDELNEDWDIAKQPSDAAALVARAESATCP